MFNFFSVSVTHHDGLLMVHTPLSFWGCVSAVFFGFLALLFLAGLTDNPFRAAQVGKALSYYSIKLVVFLALVLCTAIGVESNTLILNAKEHTATEENRYLVFKTKKTYEISRIARAEVYGSRNGGADRLSLVFANGHVHPLTANNGKYGKDEAAMAINNYLAGAQ